MTVLGLGTAAGLVFALPVETGSVACPPAREGRVNCLLQHAWAPAAVKVAAAIFVAWLIGELLFGRLPEMLRRRRSGERLSRRPADHGRAAVLNDGVLAAASWGVVPEAKPAWRAVKAVPNPALAAALPAPLPAPIVLPEEPMVPLAQHDPPEPVFDGIRALGTLERRFRGASPEAGRIRVLGADESRARRLRRAGDPALVVSCWSDASSAHDVPDHAGA
jgi:hypothetical protein